MRADRLISTLLLMQARGRVTAGELAAELEISVATARRDLEALSAAGIPVYPQTGRGGGWSLLGGARTDLTGLTSSEAQELFLLLGPAASSPEARSALRKLLRAVPAPFRQDAEAAADAVITDPTAWSESRSVEEPHRALLESAIVARRAVRITYAGWQQEARERTVEPWALADKDGTWYLLAGTPNGRRTFRLDRILTAAATDTTFERPAHLDAEATWRESVEEVERLRATAEAVVLVDRRLLSFLRRQFGRNCVIEEELDDGRVRVRIAAQTPTLVARFLAGWGRHTEVLGPPEVQQELAQIGRELAARYP
ncbi:MAG TPA: WYL domain-containing protein [Naasia sp.]|jgi:predicted DNA-binding transcriptional regulator YafY